MSEPFDPYYHWLGIPPGDGPPDHYRLLGIRPYESDANIIRAAAEQRFVYLRTFQLSPQADLAERLLNEVAAAKLCLLDSRMKATYDAGLKQVQSLASEATESSFESNSKAGPAKRARPPLPPKPSAPSSRVGQANGAPPTPALDSPTPDWLEEPETLSLPPGPAEAAGTVTREPVEPPFYRRLLQPFGRWKAIGIVTGTILVLITAALVFRSLTGRNGNPFARCPAPNAARPTTDSGATPNKSRSLTGSNSDRTKPGASAPPLPGEPSEPPSGEDKRLRRAPQLHTVQELRGEAGRGAMALVVTGDAEAPQLNSPLGARQSANSEVSAADMPEMVTIGKRWIVLTGLIDLAKQAKAYREVFSGTMMPEAPEDTSPHAPGLEPQYCHAGVERVEVWDDAEIDESRWQRIDPEEQLSIAVGQPGTKASTVDGSSPLWQRGDVVHESFLTKSPRVTFPLASVWGRRWGPEVAHAPEIPLRTEMLGQRHEKPQRQLVGSNVSQSATGVPAATSPFRLFRFFDFSVEPGKKYRYRVKLWLANPAQGMPVDSLPEELVDRNNGGLEPKKYLGSEFSEVSGVISVPWDSRVLVESVKSPRSVTAEPIAGMTLVHFDETTGNESTLGVSDVPRGQLVNYIQETQIVKPTADVKAAESAKRGANMPAAREPGSRKGNAQNVDTRETMYHAESLVLDMQGGNRLLGERDAKLTRPGNLLLLEPDGSLLVRGELDDIEEIADAKSRHVPERRVTSTSTGNDLLPAMAENTKRVAVPVEPRRAFLEVIWIKEHPSWEWRVHARLTALELDAKIAEYQREGLRPMCISGYEEAGERLYAVMWIADDSPHVLKYGISERDAAQVLRSLPAGFHPVWRNDCRLGSTDAVALILINDNSPCTVWWSSDMSLASFNKTKREFEHQGYRPVFVSVSPGSNPRLKRYHTGWANDGIQAAMFVDMSPEDYQRKVRTTPSRSRLAWVNAYGSEGERNYAGIWVADAEQVEWQVSVGLPLEDWTRESEKRRAAGFRPSLITAH